MQQRTIRFWQSSRLRFALTVLVALGLVVPLSTAAEEPGEQSLSVNRFAQFPQQARNMLSGPAWLAVEGLDPRFLEADSLRPQNSNIFAPAPGSGGNRAVAAQQVPFRNPAPAFSRNLILTRQVGMAPINLEPDMEVDPTDPEHLVVGVIDYNMLGAAAYVSFDGGETWEGPKQVRYFQEDLAPLGDPVVSFDSEGNVYMAQMSLGLEEARVGTLITEFQVTKMVVAKSTDGGLTWNDPVVAAESRIQTQAATDPAGKERGQIRIPFLDKEWMAAGPNPTNPEQDALYLTYTEFAETVQIIYSDELPFLQFVYLETAIFSVASLDGGRTWSDPVQVSPTALFSQGSESELEGEGGRGETDTGSVYGDVNATDQAVQSGGALDSILAQQADEAATESDRFVQWSQPVVLPDGTVAVSYFDSTSDGSNEGLGAIMLATSGDQGKTFGSPVQAGVFLETHRYPRTATFRYTMGPHIAAGPEGEIYIATTVIPADKDTDDGDIYLLRSFDKGQTWQEPARINQDDTTRLQFFPAITVSPDGALHIMWGDTREDPLEFRYNIYYTRSQDKGATFGFEDPQQGISFPDTRVTDFASNSQRAFPNGAFIGDYFAIAANEEDVYMVWADSRLGEFGGPNQQIAFARQRAIRPSEIFLNPSSGPAGRDVTIQGFRYQPESNVQILVGGVIVANQRTNAEGEFTTQIFMPVTGEGAQSIQVYDETGNQATASFYTEFGFDNIRTAQAELAQQIEALRQQLAGNAAAAPAPTTAPLPAPAAPSPTPTS